MTDTCQRCGGSGFVYDDECCDAGDFPQTLGMGAEQFHVHTSFDHDAKQTNDRIDAAYNAGVADERKRMIDELVNAATDCDGHTPYSILMALAEEAREQEVEG